MHGLRWDVRVSISNLYPINRPIIAPGTAPREEGQHELNRRLCLRIKAGASLCAQLRPAMRLARPARDLPILRCERVAPWIYSNEVLSTPPTVAKMYVSFRKCSFAMKVRGVGISVTFIHVLTVFRVRCATLRSCETTGAHSCRQRRSGVS